MTTPALLAYSRRLRGQVTPGVWDQFLARQLSATLLEITRRLSQNETLSRDTCPESGHPEVEPCGNQGGTESA